jgi:hypothetical protein
MVLLFFEEGKRCTSWRHVKMNERCDWLLIKGSLHSLSDFSHIMPFKPLLEMAFAHSFIPSPYTLHLLEHTMDLPGRTENTVSKGGKLPVTVFTGFVGVGKTVRTLSPFFFYFLSYIVRRVHSICILTHDMI